MTFKKMAVIVGLLTLTSCGMFHKGGHHEGKMKCDGKSCSMKDKKSCCGKSCDMDKKDKKCCADKDAAAEAAK